MFSIGGGGQMKILLVLTEVKGAGWVETFPQKRAWHLNLKSNSITLLPSMSTNMITRTHPSVNRDILRLLEKVTGLQSGTLYYFASGPGQVPFRDTQPLLLVSSAF
jgi:hypothetical protein